MLIVTAGILSILVIMIMSFIIFKPHGQKKILKDKTIIGLGYDLLKGDKLDIKNITLSDSQRSGHVFGMGTTRIGKTRLMENMIEQDIIKGRSIIFIDPKSDFDILSKINQVAFREGRQDELLYISLLKPQYSIKFNPLSHYIIPEELVHHTVSGIKTSEEFFINVAYETTLVIATSILMIRQAGGSLKEGIGRKDEPLNFADIGYWTSQESLKSLKNILENTKMGTGDSTNKDSMVHLLEQLISSPSDYFNKISSTLRTMLTMLTTGNMGKICGHAKENPIMERLEAGKRIILVVQTDALLTRKPSYLLARLVISSIQSYVGRVFSNGSVIDPPLCLYIDEASNVLYDGIENLFNKAGGAGLWITAFTQSISDIVAELGADRTKKIIDNANTKIYMRVNDPDTADFVSKASGIIKGYSHVIGLGGQYSLMQKEMPLVDKEVILNLGNREFLFFGPDGRYKGMTLYTKKSYANIKVNI